MKNPGLKTIIANGLVFLLPLVTLTANRAVSTCSFAFVLMAMFLLKGSGSVLRRHLSEIRWILIAFLLNFLLVYASFLLRPNEVLGTLEKPVRMLFASAALLVVLVLRPNRKSLWLGVMASAVAGAMFVGYQRWDLGMQRPGGLINAITYGDLALLMGLLSLAALIDLRDSKRSIWPWLTGLAALAGLIGSIFTGTRGGWVALIAALFLFFKYSHLVRGKSIATICTLALGVLFIAYLVPQTGMRERAAVAIDEVRNYFNGTGTFTSIGLRFELWKAAALLIRQHPLTGSGIVSYRSELAAAVTSEHLNPEILTLPHMHNDALQVLTTGGLIGFSAWLATLLAPFIFFLKVLNRRDVSKERTALALAGALLVLSYFCFGLTEVIFWSMRSSLFYALMVFLLVGFCLLAKERDGE